MTKQEQIDKLTLEKYKLEIEIARLKEQVRRLENEKLQSTYM